MEYTTNEKNMSQFLSQYYGVTGGRCGDIYNTEGPNMRKVPGPGRSKVLRLKSTSENIFLNKKKPGRGFCLFSKSKRFPT